MRIVAFIGFGEAARAFARPGDRAFDIKTMAAATAAEKHRDYASAGVCGYDLAEQALAGADVVLSLVTADQALPAAFQYAPSISPGALWLDMNSVAPGTKRAAAFVVEAVGGRYVDVAVMAPVDPARRSVPLLVSGAHRADAIAALSAMGFPVVSDGGARVGDASAVKMIRSVIVKGIEALTAEAGMAAYRAGVADAVLASLDGSWKAQPWAERTDYNLERMMTHGLRRATEMEEAVRTLQELGIDPVMTRATVERQRAAGRLSASVPEGLEAKLDMIAPEHKGAAA